MPLKRKHPFLSAPQGGRKNPRLSSRPQKKDEIEEHCPTDLSDPLSLPPQEIEQIRKTVDKKVDHGKKLVFRGLKKAKGFEKQKLVKRLKIAREKYEDAAVKKLELEFEVLKTEEIDLNSLASSHILKTFSKLKNISTSPLFPPWLVPQKEPEPQLNDREIARRNIIARLYNSNAVKEAMAVMVGNVKNTIGVVDGDSKAEKKGIRIENSTKLGEDVGEEEAVEAVHLVKEMTIGSESFTDEDYESEEEWGGISDPGESTDLGMTLDDIAAKFEDRIAGSSDEDEDQGPLQRGVDDEWSGDEEEGDSDDNNDDDEEPEDDEEWDDDEGGGSEEYTQDAKLITGKSKSQPKHQSREAASKSKLSQGLKPIHSTTSTFLPTLMSGYISGSDSDIDADYYKNKTGKKKGPAQPKERKNRMGQQARRALWEKKFGKDANHVKKSNEEQGRKKIERRIKQGRVGDGKKPGGSIEKRGKNPEAEGPLHPSWEAARKAKEQQAKVQEAVMGKPMGKKIVFD